MKINSDTEDSIVVRKSSISPINKETLFASNNFESSELDVDPSVSQKKSHEI
jgi:hypothetical protein